jgi:4-hydroxy-tetrahydrodipicolinate reductase
MGTVVCNLAAENPNMEVVAGIEIVEAGGGMPFPVYGDINQCAMPADAIINFLPPTAAISDALAIVDFSVKRQIPLVICTTGMPPELENALFAASKEVAILRSANMSLGINLLSGLLKRVSRLLHDTNFDIEIIEKHHNQKLDAPSGTALLLADSINNALDNKLSYTNDRSKTHAKRPLNEIGLHALRGGTIVGEHSVIFAGRDEVIEFTHIAQSREVFAVGALKAAEFICGKTPGMYSMQNLIDEL